MAEGSKPYRFERAARADLRQRVVAGQVVIMAVAHHRREPGSWEGR